MFKLFLYHLHRALFLWLENLASKAPANVAGLVPGYLQYVHCAFLKIKIIYNKIKTLNNHFMFRNSRTNLIFWLAVFQLQVRTISMVTIYIHSTSSVIMEHLLVLFSQLSRRNSKDIFWYMIRTLQLIFVKIVDHFDYFSTMPRHRQYLEYIYIFPSMAIVLTFW